MFDMKTATFVQASKISPLPEKRLDDRRFRGVASKALVTFHDTQLNCGPQGKNHVPEDHICRSRQSLALSSTRGTSAQIVEPIGFDGSNRWIFMQDRAHEVARCDISVHM